MPPSPNETREIERKYLVDTMPDDLEAYPCAAIVQGYLVIGEDGGEVRLRRKGEACLLTVKRGEGRTRFEAEVELTRDQFDALWPGVDDRVVEKVRYALPYGPHTIEFDVYHGRHEGLLTAEVEFDSEDESDAFTPPPWFGREVTDDPRYRNRELARRATRGRGDAETRGEQKRGRVGEGGKGRK